MKTSTSFPETPINAVRDYWNARPCNIRHSTKAVGTREYFDEVEARKYFVEYHIPGFADFERWRDADPARASVFAQLARTWGLMDKLRADAPALPPANLDRLTMRV